MEKQKQIEEMVNDLYGDAIEIKGDCEYVAETMYEKGYRKIPEGAVVLTGTETEERLEDLLIEFDEMSFYPATLMPNAEECAREWKRKLIYAIGQLRKETAEKFAERLKALFPINEDIFSFTTSEKIHKAVDEICEEIKEEGK